MSTVGFSVVLNANDTTTWVATVQILGVCQSFNIPSFFTVFQDNGLQISGIDDFLEFTYTQNPPPYPNFMNFASGTTYAPWNPT